MPFPQNVLKLFAAVRRFGIGGVTPYFASYRRKRSEAKNYQNWIKNNTINDQDREEMRQTIDKFDARPLISIVLPVYDVDEKWLHNCIDSVIAQLYPHWELCIADDASTRDYIRPLIEQYAASDERIKSVFRPVNGHISEASNSALEIATGEFTVLLDHDDELSEDALFWVASVLNEHPDIAMIYSDEDLIDEDGNRSEPKFKPDFSRDLLYSLNLVTHLSAYRTELLRKVGGFRIGLEGSQDYDLALRVAEQIPETAIRHIPRILYHWRTIPTSVAGNAGAKPYAFNKAREAIASHFERTGIAAEIVTAVDELNRVRYTLPTPLPRVSIIVNGKPETQLRSKTDYLELELIAVGSGTQLAHRLNAAAETATGEVLCFLEGCLEPISRDWLKEMVSFAIQPNIGAVGAKLLSKNGSIDQTGLIVGGEDVIRKAHNDFPKMHPGNFFRAALIGNYSAVSWRCLAVRRKVFEQIGGFDAENLQEKLFDADFCLRIWEGGYRVVYTPYAEMISASEHRDSPPTLSESEYFSGRWKKTLDRDPFHNPNFAASSEPFRLDS